MDWGGGGQATILFSSLPLLPYIPNHMLMTRLPAEVKAAEGSECGLASALPRWEHLFPTRLFPRALLGDLRKAGTFLLRGNLR